MTNRPLLLPTYPEYKPSGLPWMGEIPAHWKVAAVKWNYAIQLGKMLQNEPKNPADVETPYLKAQHVQWFSVRTTDAPTMWASPRDIEHFGIRKGDLLVCEGGEGGRSAIVGDVPPGCIIQNALHRVRPRGNCRNDYLLYVMSEIGRAGWFNAINNAVTIPHFTVQKFRSLKVPIPPIEEQAAIARYLTHKDNLIQRWLSAKRRLLASLKQLRKSTIHYAVIHGLDPDNTHMKPSGIPWLDEIPAHWQTIPLKHWVRINQAVLPENTDPNYEFRYIDIGSIGTGVRVEEPEKMRFETAPSRARRIVRNGDTIFSTVRTYLKAVWFADDPDDDLICSTGFAVFTPRQNTSQKFVSYVAQSDSFINRVTANSFGVTYPAINTSRLGSLRVPVPPLEEQAAIAEYLDDRIAKIDAAIAVTSRLIDLMEQYRKSLIHELVTGARDVRKAAAAIPDAPPPNPPAPTPDPSTP